MIGKRDLSCIWRARGEGRDTVQEWTGSLLNDVKHSVSRPMEGSKSYTTASSSISERDRDNNRDRAGLLAVVDQASTPNAFVHQYPYLLLLHFFFFLEYIICVISSWVTLNV